jgi:ribosome biogenesis GTPase
MEGLVIKSTGSFITVRKPDGRLIMCKVKGQFKMHGKKTTNPVAVGDRVDVLEVPGQEIGLINRLHERHNYIIRKSKKLSKIYHVIAANIDQAILVVTVAFPHTHTGFIDRFLTTAEAYHIPAILVFNKIDLYNEEMIDRHVEMTTIYEMAGYPMLQVSAKRGDNIDKLALLLKDKITLFSGHSGVGKSALINAIQPGLNLRTGTISDYHNKGKHTTTFAEMVPLDNGGYIIDSPGIREFGLTDFKKQEVAERFPEFRAIMHDCQFANCSHTKEPNCAVKAALENGDIHPSRYHNYLSIYNDEDFDEIDWREEVKR